MTAEQRYKATPRADVVWLAKEWERLLAALEYPTRAYALQLLLALVQTFLRGQGARMGSAQGLQRHGGNSILVYIAVTNLVVEDSSDSTFYPTLVKIGFTSKTAVNDIVAQDLKRTLAQ